MVDQTDRRRPESSRTRGAVACVALLVAATALSGCSSSAPPEIHSTPSPAVARACRELVADLPGTLAGESSVDVAGDDDLGAAWGDPPLVLTCGVGPMDLSAVPACDQVDGIGWLVPPEQTQGDRDVTFTADGWRPRVQLEVPQDYLPEKGAAALTELAGVLKEHLRRVEKCV